MNLDTAQIPSATHASLDWLRDQIAAREGRRLEDDPPIPTGWAPIDQAIGGLRRGATHEWFTQKPASGDHHGPWIPPLMVLSYLSYQASRAMPEAWIVCIGRRVWPSVLRLATPLPLGERAGSRSDPGEGNPRALPRPSLGRWLMIDPPRADERIWAIDAALRCGQLVVIADGSGLDTAATRRLQLAAEAGGSLGLIARPPSDAHRISIAETRWQVSPAVSPNEQARWKVRALRTRGHAARCPDVLVECCHDGSVVRVSDEVGHRSGATSTPTPTDAGDRARPGRASA